MVEGLRPCPTCGAPVAPGRLSCPSCGTLLASVSGRAELPAVAEAPSADESMVPGSSPEPAEDSIVRPPDPSRPAPSVLHPMSDGDDGSVSRGPSRGAAGTPMPAYTSVPTAGSAPGELATNQWYSLRPAGRAGPDPGSAPAGAATAGAAVAAWAPAAPAMPSRTTEPTTAAPAERDRAGARVGPTAGLLSDLPFSAPSTVAAWIATVGAFVAGAAVILPWRATPGLPYLTLWGAAMPSVVVAAIVALVTGLIAITPSRLAPRVRWGFIPFFVGAFGVGAAWMWQSLYAADFGLWVYVGGSIVAAVGGALSLSGWAEPTSR